jgi:hypothetical protein
MVAALEMTEGRRLNNLGCASALFSMVAYALFFSLRPVSLS